MLQQKINHVSAELGELGGQVSEDAWEKIKACRNELADAADVAHELENNLALSEAPQDMPYTD